MRLIQNKHHSEDSVVSGLKKEYSLYSETEKGSRQRTFSIDSEEIVLQIFEYPSYVTSEFEVLLDYFMKSEDEINLTAAGYACTILESVFEADETAVNAFKRLFSKDVFLERLLKLIQLTTVSNLFKNSLIGVSNDRKDSEHMSDQLLYYRAYISHRIAQQLLNTTSDTATENACHIFRYLINARENILDSAYLIRMTLLTESFFTDLVSKACNSVACQVTAERGDEERLAVASQ